MSSGQINFVVYKRIYKEKSQEKSLYKYNQGNNILRKKSEIIQSLKKESLWK